MAIGTDLDVGSQLRVFEMESLGGRLVSGHTDLVLAVDVSPDGRYIASCSKDNTVRIWVRPLFFLSSSSFSSSFSSSSSFSFFYISFVNERVITDDRRRAATSAWRR
ncbi:unnamed protein product [marine sediment metagenome]|uniref:Uncharacterized protein n=1 Tax=marine sediment metagenome TaxID=412755 RepID=X1SAI9_9ZZZZ